MYVIIFVTCPDGKTAEKLGEILLKKRLAACINVIYTIKSLYWWKKKIEKNHEVLMIIKTREKLVDDLIKTVKKLHPYETPEIIAIPIKKGLKNYLEWIKKETI